MAIANLHETLLMYTTRKSQLQLEINELQSRKTLSTMDQADASLLFSTEKSSLREYFKKLYEEDPTLQEQYKDYTEIPEFEEELNKLQARLDEQLEELTSWETAIDAQITTDSAELEEINAYMESMKSMLTANIQEDFKFGLGN